MTAKIVVSLDFELRWGLADVLGEDVTAYRRNLEGVVDVVPRLLELFANRGVEATWAVVGALACQDWDEWLGRTPTSPRYDDATLRWRDAYRMLDPNGRLHFAPALVEEIGRTRGQELGSHTFSHIYLREPGITREDVERDTDAVASLFAARFGRRPTSFVFPRNQVGHLSVLRERGIRVWRDTPRPFFWRATRGNEQSKTMRSLRLADSILPLGKRRSAEQEHRASYFVRVGLPEPLWRAHRARIRSDARHLRSGETLHLWWHPHNLGAAPAASCARVAELLDDVATGAPQARFASMRDLVAV